MKDTKIKKETKIKMEIKIKDDTKTKKEKKSRKKCKSMGPKNGPNVTKTEMSPKLKCHQN